MEPIIELPSLRIPWKRICTHGACVSAAVGGLAYGATAQSYQPVLRANESKINILEGTAEKLEWERDKAKSETKEIQEAKKQTEISLNTNRQEFNINQADLNNRYIAETKKVEELNNKVNSLESKFNRTKHRLSSIIHGYQNKATWKFEIMKLINEIK